MTDILPARQPSRATDAAWRDLERALAGSLAQLEEGEHLILSRKGANIYVQFAAGGEDGMRAEAV